MGSGVSSTKGHAQFGTQSVEHFSQIKNGSMSTAETRTSSAVPISLEKRYIDEETKSFEKHLEDIFGPTMTTESETGKRSNNADAQSDDSNLDLVVLLSAEDIRSNHKELSSSIPDFDDPIIEQLSGLADDIDDALTGHDDVMKEIRGLSLINTVQSSTGTIEGPVGGLRMKGSTIEPLPGVIPVRVNWADPENILRQERLVHKTFEARMKSLHDMKLKAEQGPGNKTTSCNGPTVSGDRASDTQSDSFEPKPKIIITRPNYTEEEIALMRTIEQEYDL